MKNKITTFPLRWYTTLAFFFLITYLGGWPTILLAEFLEVIK